MEAMILPAEQLLTPEKIKEIAIAKLLEFEQEEFFIDAGGAARVYELPAGYCLKIIHNKNIDQNSDMFLRGNTANQEALLQQQMSQTTFDGATRAPGMFGVLQATAPGDTNAIIMERLDAVNLQHVISGKAELPDGFNIHAFFEDLEAYVKHMHKHEKLIHMDLHARNIMVDRETAMPRMIDFGKAIRTTNTTPEVQIFTNEDQDWKSLNEAFNDLDKKL